MDPTAALSSFSGLVSLARGLTALKTDTEVEQVRSALLGQITEVQQTTLQLQEDLLRARERSSELERELKEMHDWSKEKERYTLKELGRGAYAYVEALPTEGGQATEALLCTHCYEDRKRSILQFQGTDLAGSVLLCPRCKNRVVYRDRVREEEARARAQLVQRLSRT